MSRQQVRTTQGRNTYTGRDAIRNNKTGAYVEGNTVRKLNAHPERLPRKQEREEVGSRPQVDRQTRANRERAMRMSPAYLVFLTMALVVSVGICSLYIQVQSEHNSLRRSVAALESRVLDLRTDNDAALNRIETSVDLNVVRDTAMNSLGMVYPSKEQIVYFEVDLNDYMNQYQDIPEE